MFTSIKKWVKNEDNPPSRGATSVSGMQTMRSDLQRKFAKGVQYNLKIIIRGDRNTGKTCLWHRLQGHKFLEEYVPTPEIQAASIHWNYKATDDVVKVDVWDVVDQGKPKKPKETLKLDHKDDENDELQLDASFLDVYKGAHAVIMVFDITKKWTFNYIERELPKVPPHIPVLILGNHRDMGDHRVISFDEIEALTESIERPPGSAGVSFLETSMKEGFGLKYIHKFINMPFLLLQRESLLKQLETNHLDMESCLEELQYTAASDEHSYEAFKERPKNPPKSTSTPVQSKPDIVNAKPPTPNTTPSTNDCKKPPTTLNIPQTQQARDSEPISPSGGLFSPSEMSEVPSQPTETTQPEKRGFMSRLFRGSSTTKSDSVKSDPPPVTPPVSNPPPVKSIEEFVPHDEAVDDFLNSISDPADKIRHQDSDESSSDDDGGNPMVAGFQEELDSDDQMPDAGSHKVYTYSDSDEDYTASTQAKRVTQPKKQSSRGKPASRLSPAQDRRNDSNLQGFMIESDSSYENDAQPPSILPDAESLSENDLAEAESPKSKPVNHIEQNTATQLYKSDSNQYLRNERNKKTKENDSNSSDNAEDNVMVSNVIEDISSSEEQIPSAAPVNQVTEELENRLQLQSSDFDFLEQITSKPAQVDTKQSSKSEDRPRKKKSKTPTDETEEGRRHKHKKKKKSKSKEEPINGEEKTGKKKKRRTKTTDDNDLESFLGGGES